MASKEASPESQDELTPARDTQSAPLLDKEALMKKLEQIPVETLRSILTNQVDLEIRLKHRELRLTEEEMGKCEAQMLALRKFFEVPNDVHLDKEPNDFTVKYFDLLNKSLSISYTQIQKQRYQEEPKFKQDVFEQPSMSSHYRTRSTTSSLRPSFTTSGLRVAGCLYRRTDGVVVKLTCPDCHRSNFSSAQGFLNHSRIAHSQEYTSQDAAALRCGEILPNDLQDEEGLASLNMLRLKNKDPSQNLNINEIYFNGLSNSLNTVHRGSDTLESDVTQAKASTGSTSEKSPVINNEEHSARASSASETKFEKPVVGGNRSDSIEEAESQALMNKLIQNGVAHNAKEYGALIREARQSIPNSHLFDDEEEIAEIPAEKSDSVHEPHRAESESKINRATSNRVTRTEENSTTGQPADTHDHSGSGSGKYENRLRRRKSRGTVGVRPFKDNYLEALEEEEKANQSKRRRKQ